ncbi:hypothetical protein E2C01_039477 [Portunus trituberculatus]|uniref:Uncharacterized protein n=1 Tax=Portunus trituberculatus TaxID=210409 RepID=A0A5B7FGY3_PORTR|nr:hypothetical protein [Portunus trituberculatus]
MMLNKDEKEGQLYNTWRCAVLKSSPAELVAVHRYSPDCSGLRFMILSTPVSVFTWKSSPFSSGTLLLSTQEYSGAGFPVAPHSNTASLCSFPVMFCGGMLMTGGMFTSTCISICFMEPRAGTLALHRYVPSSASVTSLM